MATGTWPCTILAYARLAISNLQLFGANTGRRVETDSDLPETRIAAVLT